MTVFHISDALLLPSPEDGRVSSEEDLEFFSNEADSIFFFFRTIFSKEVTKRQSLNPYFSQGTDMN